jgi:hypothetical protein
LGRTLGCHQLDDDLLSAVLYRLDDAKHICRSARVSRAWRRVSSSDDLWRHAFLQRWGAAAAATLVDTDLPARADAPTLQTQTQSTQAPSAQDWPLRGVTP